MRSLSGLRAGLHGLAPLAALVVGLGGPAAMATQGGDDGGGGDKGGKGGQTREQGIYYESGEADSPPAGFVTLTRALSAFQDYSLYLSPDEATARFLFDFTYGPLIELFTALSFQQQFGAPREAQSAPPEPKAASNETTGFFQLGQGLSVLERVQISEKLSGVLGRKDALITEEEGGLPYWIFEEDCGKNSGAAGGPAPPRIIWDTEAASDDAAKGASKAKPATGKAPAADCKEESIRKMERRALDFLDGEYLWLQQRFGAKDKKALERKAGVIKDKLFDDLKKERKRSQ